MSRDEERTTRGIRRILIVSVVAVGAFFAAMVVVSDDGRDPCATAASQDPAYQARLLGPTGRSGFEIAVTRGGRPVTGATVCAAAAVVGFGVMGPTTLAEEGAPGIYRVALVPDAVGRWDGDVLIAEAGQRAVRVPLRIGAV